MSPRLSAWALALALVACEDKRSGRAPDASDAARDASDAARDASDVARDSDDAAKGAVPPDSSEVPPGSSDVASDDASSFVLPESSDGARADASSDAARADASSAVRAEDPDGGAADAKPAWAFDCTDASAPKAGKSIGHTSVVFKVELASGKKAAWKPNAKNVKGRYKGEAAAYRLAAALGIPNVPPACVRAFDARAAAAALAPNAAAAKLFADEAIVEGGKVYGVVIPWIDGLSFWPLEREPLRSEARAWLAAGGAIPPAKLELARQASTLVAFDFITGNWDRYSGENVGLDRSGSRVLYVDNDAAFMELPPKDRLTENKARLDATARFSRRLIARARALDEARLASVLGEEAPGRPLVSAAVVSAVARRIAALVAVVDAKIVARGEAATLYFP
ncbi:MAG: hypothetical protein KF764_13480 [Labilithrix sp.]|nr:hypothetical protein [Labilithrix sp.]